MRIGGLELDFEFCFCFHKCLILQDVSCRSQGEMSLNEQIFQACKELIDDAKNGCADLVFKEICLEILSRASHVLTRQQFKKLASYAAQRMREEMPIEVREQELAWNR